MSASDPTDELTRALEHQRRTLERVVEQLAAVGPVHREHLKRADAVHLEGWRTFGLAAVPALDDVLALARASSLLRMPGLAPAAAADAVEARRERMEARRQELEEKTDIATARARAESFLAKQAELADHAAALRQSVQELERDADFREYKQRADDTSWWTLSHYRVQAAGRRTVERLGARRRVDSPEALLRKHRDEREALATLERELTQIGDEQRRLREIADEHAQLGEQLAGVEDAIADEMRHAVVETVRSLPESNLLDLVASQPELRAAARAIAGSRAVRRYLVACYAHWVERARAELSTTLQDLELAVASGEGRLARSGTPGEIDADTAHKARAHDENIRLYGATAERMLAFQAWDRCDPRAGELWWDHVAGGVVDGSFIDEVAWHRTMQRAPVTQMLGGGVDKRDGWSNNAETASERLAKAAAAWREEADDDD